jgi:hypothetical protein
MSALCIRKLTISRSYIASSVCLSTGLTFKLFSVMSLFSYLLLLVHVSYSGLVVYIHDPPIYGSIF